MVAGSGPACSGQPHLLVLHVRGFRLLCHLASGGAGIPKPAVGVYPDARVLGRCDHRTVRKTVLIVDDHEAFRRAARRLLEADGFEVVGEAVDGESAIAEAARLRPRIVLLDIQLPDADGLELAARFAEAGDPPAVVLTSSRGASAYRRRLAQSPARGFIAKNELSGEALAALLH
jgi:CheY-like chemotaxis protein